MKNIIILISILLLIVSQGFAQDQVLSASFNYATFYSHDNGPYLETNLSVIGNSAKFMINNKANTMQAEIEVTMIFKRNETVVTFRKYNLLSPEIDLDVVAKPNFIDLQRILLEPGNYTLELTIKDKNYETEAFKYSEDFTIDYNSTDVAISDMLFVENYSKSKEQNILSKSGYDLVPYVSNFYPKNIDEFIFYVEIYNVNKVLSNNESFLLKYYIETYDNNRDLFEYNGFSKEKAQDINVLLRKMDISKLPSGNFNVVVELRNKQNELIKQRKYFFQRSNPGFAFNVLDMPAINTSNTFVNKYNNVDSLKDYLKSMFPICEIAERRYIDNLLNQDNIDNMKQFLYNYWSAKNSTNTELEWEKYKYKVKLVNDAYSTQIVKGYESSRGIVYLKYGAPNAISERKHEPNTYPFEIWQYYELDGKQNRKFLFYNPNVVGNDYELLHSNVQGEVINKNWVSFIQGRVMATGNRTRDMGSDSSIDRDTNYGTQLMQMWQNP